MDLTPHDLRNAELREAFRGYRPDEVEELLERAAVALERLHERNRLLTERISQAEQASTEGREIEGVMRQTLLLAQRTADEAVTSAHERARQLVEEAEDRALALVSEAEEQARTTGETQRRKHETIVAELSARRTALVADVDALERAQSDYRARLRGVLERELEALERAPVLPPLARPDLNEIDLSTGGDTEDSDPPGDLVDTARARASAGAAGARRETSKPDDATTGELKLSPWAEDPETDEATSAMLVPGEERSGNGRSGPARRPL